MMFSRNRSATAVATKTVRITQQLAHARLNLAAGTYRIPADRDLPPVLRHISEPADDNPQAPLLDLEALERDLAWRPASTEPDTLDERELLEFFAWDIVKLADARGHCSFPEPSGFVIDGKGRRMNVWRRGDVVAWMNVVRTLTERVS